MSGTQGDKDRGALPRVVTFGCRLNSFESEVMREHAAAAGWQDVIIVNTCAVTGEAERQARQAIRKLKHENPEARIVVTGCAAQITPEAFGRMAEVDRVLGNAEKMDAAYYREADPARVSVGETQAMRGVSAHLVGGFEGRVRAFVEIQQGCDHRCTFCVIPLGRGPNRSTPFSVIAGRVRALIEAGYRELVLTGVDICSYGGEIPDQPGLGALVRRLLREFPDLPRLRLTSLDPAAIDDELLDLIALEDRLMPHFHLSVQAGDDMVLRRMKRRHTRDEVLALARQLRRLRPGCALGADMIAGFPTETEAMFENGAALIGEAGFSHLHVFPYSPRPGTPAARLPQLGRAVAKERAARLRALGKQAMAAFQDARIGGIAPVLAEREDFGHDPCYLPVRLKGNAVPGTIVAARIVSREGERLIGEVEA